MADSEIETFIQIFNFPAALPRNVKSLIKKPKRNAQVKKTLVAKTKKPPKAVVKKVAISKAKRTSKTAVTKPKVGAINKRSKKDSPKDDRSYVATC